jgi:hypothetical protein
MAEREAGHLVGVMAALMAAASVMMKGRLKADQRVD